MDIYILTLFPGSFSPVLNSSILRRAQEKNLVRFHLIDLRNFGIGKHRSVDDRPYGGGAGMVLRADILAQAVNSIVKKKRKARVVLMSASGKPLTQDKARDFSRLDQLIIVCGHYEGVDQRFIEKYVTEEISIGDYVLTGGELPAMVVIDATTRLIPGVLEKEEATREESFSTQLLEYPQYTRPEEFEGEKVPQVLLSGNHQQISHWRVQKSLEKTKKVRPDLLKKYN